jgi:hypothetical protein
MTDIALLIADMVKQGVSAEIVGRVAAALAEREPVVVKDENAERRRAADRERKRNVRGNPQNSPDGGGNGSPSPNGPFPFPHTPNPNPLNPPSPPQTTEGARGEIVQLPNRRAHRLPADFTLTPADLNHARKRGSPMSRSAESLTVSATTGLQPLALTLPSSNGTPLGAIGSGRPLTVSPTLATMHPVDTDQEPSGILGAYQRAAARFRDPDDVPG